MSRLPRTAACAALCIVVTCSAPARVSPPDPARPAAAASGRQAGSDGTRMLAQPALGGEHVAFVYAGDLWVARLGDGGARRLTTHPGLEIRPRFSPDGRWIAFSGQYDGNMDVYVVPVEGGEPRRLTWHPGVDVVEGFTHDGEEVLFTSRRDSYTNRFWRLFGVGLEGGFPGDYGLPTCSNVSMSPDGTKIAYNPLSDAFNQWKNYRGGRTSRIWIYDLGDRSVEEIPQPDGRCNDADPIWVGDGIWFRSDRAGEFNLHAYDPGSKEIVRVTDHADFPVESATAAGGRVVYEQAGWLHLLDSGPGSTSERLGIRVAADLIETRPRFVDGERYVRSGDVSPSGKRAVLGFRGEIVTVPAEKGDPRNLTMTPAANERDPVWSPDGRTIAFFSDESGENQLVIAPQDGRGERRSIELPGAGFYEDPSWSPDGKKLSYIDNSRSLYVLDVESGLSEAVAREPIYGVYPSIAHAWSPDSRWLAYTLITETGFKQLSLLEVETGNSHTITDGLSDVSDPVFDAGGKYLYLAASTDAGPFVTWFSQASADVETTNSLYLVCLAADTPSPLAKESDEEEPEAEEEEEEEEGDEESDEEEDSVEVAVDFEGLGQRIVALPLERAYYTDLRPGKPGQLFYLKAERGEFSGSSPSALARFDLEEREEKVLLEGVQDFALTREAEKVFFRTGEGMWITPVADSIDKSEGRLAVGSIQVKIDPRAEWAQIFDEAWRINRDYFYDPGMHGADWPAMKEKYAQFLPHLATRVDLGRVIRWLCSELAVGHSYGGGGDTLIDAESVPGGLLGADYEIDDDRYRFRKVLGGLNWTPDLRAPLTEPGVGVRAGEYLLAVNGVDLRPPENLFARFENTAGKQVEITVGPNADGSDSRDVKVVPVASESALRNRDWVEGNIRKVTEATQGRVAYVHVPNTADRGFTYFKRYFFPQSDREAIIIDERHNGGGSVADYYIDILRRPYVSHWATRYGESFVTPQAAIFGPKIMLIDETAGSGGDLLPWMFRKLGLGKLVGRRTWGGLVGNLGFPELMDGGFVTAPNLGFWTEEEGFGVENVGVPPDIEVEQLPALVQDGHDPQLERAIEEILAELEASPPPRAVQPPFPVRVR